MDNPILQMYYNNYAINPNPTISYNTEIIYKNDVAIAYKYNISLKGYIMANDYPGGISQGITYINNIFSSNHGLLQIDSYYQSGEFNTVLLANNILVKGLKFNETENNWSKYAEYTVELESMNLIVGVSVESYIEMMKAGVLNVGHLSNLVSPFMVDGTSYTLKDCSEQFTLQTGESQLNRTNVVEKRFEYGIPAENTPLSIVTTVGGEYFTISYSVNAIGKQMAANYGSGAQILPAWEHAKRWVHAKLRQQMGRLFNNYLSMNGNVPREFIGSNSGDGMFSAIKDLHSQGVAVFPSFGLYNEHVSFEVSESEGSFSATYNAIIKKHCPFESNQGSLSPYTLYCNDNVNHTISKSVTQTYEANEQISLAIRNTQITINGTIEGLVPGGILDPKSRIHINNLPTGSFLCYNNKNQYPELNRGGGFDKSYFANIAFDAIFDYNKYDLQDDFKDLIGVTAYALAVNPEATLLPSNMSITRNLLEGTVNYTATYETKFNCDVNNFEIKVSTNESIPLVAEFTIPNNNVKDLNGVLCDTGKGYSAIQLLGTWSPKTIDISISASVGNDFNKCCLGTSNNYNLMDYKFFTLESYIIPSGMNIPYIGPQYALTKKSKSVTYPEGDMSISLSYTCSDFCEIDTYFKEQ